MSNKGPDTPPEKKGDQEATEPKPSLADQLKAGREQLKAPKQEEQSKPASVDPFSNFKKAVASKTDNIPNEGENETEMVESEDEWADNDEVEDEFQPAKPSLPERTTIPKATVTPIPASALSESPINKREEQTKATPVSETEPENIFGTLQKAMAARRMQSNEDDDEEEEQRQSFDADEIDDIGSLAQGSTSPPEPLGPSEVGAPASAAGAVDEPPPLPPRDDTPAPGADAAATSLGPDAPVPPPPPPPPETEAAQAPQVGPAGDDAPPPLPPREEEPAIPAQTVPKQASWTPPSGPPPPLPHREDEVPTPPPETPAPTEPAEVPLGPGPEETPIPPAEPEVPPSQSEEALLNALFTPAHTPSTQHYQDPSAETVESEEVDVGNIAIGKQSPVLTMQAPKPVGERSATLTSSSNYQDLKAYLNEPKHCAAHHLGHPVKETTMGFQPTLNLEFKNSKPAFAQQSEEGGVTYSASKNLSEQEWTDMVQNVTSLAVANAKPGASFDISHIKSPEKQKILENAFHEAITKQKISPENAPTLITGKEDKKIQKPSV